jgi:multimeric flavodoxin WrbA
MKVLALVGSPRKNGNTDLLVEKALDGARSRGHSVEKLYLYDYQTLPCIDCRKCKRGDFSCALADEMEAIYRSLADADAIIFATPVYWYGPTAKMKLLIDRLRPFIASRAMQGKSGLLVVPSEEGPACCGPLREMFKMSFQYLGMNLEGSVLATAYERGEILNRPEELERAYAMGASISMQGPDN